MARTILTVLFLFFLSLTPPACLAKSAAENTGAEKPSTEKPSKEYYFLVVEGKGMPVKDILINGINVLGGSVISLSMPINVTKEVRLGLNEVKVIYTSHESENLVTIMEKRVHGPRRQELARLVLPAKESGGKEMQKILEFNVDPAPTPPEKIELSQEDHKEIITIVDQYYDALNKKNTGKLRGLYAPALKIEHRIFPEGADFFSKVLDKEVALLRRKDIKMGSFHSKDVMLEQDGDKIKALRKDRKPMMESNEIDVSVDQLLSEVKEGEKKTKPAREKYNSKQRLVTTTLLFKQIDGKWRLALPHGV